MTRLDMSNCGTSVIAPRDDYDELSSCQRQWLWIWWLRWLCIMVHHRGTLHNGRDRRRCDLGRTWSPKRASRMAPEQASNYYNDDSDADDNDGDYHDDAWWQWRWLSWWWLMTMTVIIIMMIMTMMISLIYPWVEWAFLAIRLILFWRFANALKLTKVILIISEPKSHPSLSVPLIITSFAPETNHGQPGASFLSTNIYLITKLMFSSFHVIIVVICCKPAKYMLPLVRFVFVAFIVFNKRIKFEKKMMMMMMIIIIIIIMMMTTMIMMETFHKNSI